MISVFECLKENSIYTFPANEQKVDATLDYRISSLQAYTREGQWRLQLISGMNSSAFEFQKSKSLLSLVLLFLFLSVKEQRSIFLNFS